MIDANVAGAWEGFEKLDAESKAEVLAEAEAVVTEAADYFVAELKTTLTGERSGRAYKVSDRGPLHIASAPGEAPAVLFGALRNSVGRSVARVVDGHTVEAEVGVGLGVRAQDNETAENYAQRLEYGGVDARGIRILPRPYLAPTRDRVAPVIDDMFDNATGSR